MKTITVTHYVSNADYIIPGSLYQVKVGEPELYKSHTGREIIKQEVTFELPNIDREDEIKQFEIWNKFFPTITGNLITRLFNITKKKK